MLTYRQPFAGDFPITQRYGETVTSAFHTGIDYACPLGTPILASADGVVMAAGWDATGFGNRVIILHDGHHATLYAHLQTVAVFVNQKVSQGDVIGMSGSTGNSTGPHLHFEARTVWHDYKSHFDPMTLPLQSVDDNAVQAPTRIIDLKGPGQLGEAVKIVCPDGAWGWSPDFGKRNTVFPQGTQLHFTGKTTEHFGHTYCEVYPEPVKFWVAVHDGTTQILG